MPSILLVDDEQDFLDLIVMRLEKWGYQVTTFTEGLKAIAYLKTNLPDLVLLDLGLQDVSGLKVLAEAKAKHPALSVWVVSAYNDPDLKEQARQLKADEFIVKPFVLFELKAKLEQFFKNKGG